VYLSCGNSSRTDLPTQSVDAVVTDPPFFDNVHYSELADFFHVWQQTYFKDQQLQVGDSTRSEGEVQDADAGRFSSKLQSVFSECHRVLKDTGLLVFSYHHSREEGWTAVAEAVLRAGFTFVQCQPVKAEMSVATPKLQAKEPIDLDILLVCRKAGTDERTKVPEREALRIAADAANDKVARFNGRGRTLSRNDVLIVLFGQILVELCASREAEETLSALSAIRSEARAIVESIWVSQIARKDKRKEPGRQSFFVMA
jgi:putative DNA methylase